MKPSKGTIKSTAGFCAICGVHHDPDVPCYDLTQQALKDLGIPKKKEPASPKKFKKLARKVDNILFTALLIILAFFLFIFVLEVTK